MSHLVNSPHYITRKQAAFLIEELRVLRAESLTAHAMRATFAQWCDDLGIPPLQPCDSAAHQNPDHHDHCMRCAPRWGLIGPEVKIR